VDIFGPVHYFELNLPLILLSVVGLKNATEWLRTYRHKGVNLSVAAPLVLTFSFALVSVGGYIPVKLRTIHRISEAVNTPFEKVESANIHNAVVFSDARFHYECETSPTKSYVGWRPNNDPALENDVLWLNHLTVEYDKIMMKKKFPTRKGYIYIVTNHCAPLLISLDEVEPGIIPDAAEKDIRGFSM